MRKVKLWQPNEPAAVVSASAANIVSSERARYALALLCMTDDEFAFELRKREGSVVCASRALVLALALSSHFHLHLFCAGCFSMAKRRIGESESWSKGFGPI